MWTATVTNVEKTTEGIVLVTIQYSDGAKAFSETYKNYGAPAEDWIANTAKAKINQLEGVAATTISTGAITIKEDVVDADYVAFRSAIGKLRAIQPLIDIGAIAKDDKKVTDLIAVIQTNYIKYWDKI